MSLSQVWIPVLFYWLPMLFFFYMGIDELVRNPRKIEHRLVSAVIFCYFFLFLEEYIRYMLPITYSPVLAAYWFSNVGILIPGLGFHLLARLIGLHKVMPRPWYPYLFYILLLAIPASLLSSHSLISAQQFIEVGVWKWPLGNAAYYGTLTASLLISLLPIAMLRYARKRLAANSESDQGRIFKLLEYGTILTFVWVAVFGYFRFEAVVPPYAYMYAGLLWCSVLRLAMRRYEFLHSASHRYETIFHLSSQAILLTALEGKVKEVNPSARAMFDKVKLEDGGLTALGGHEIVDKLRRQAEIGEIETMLRNGERPVEALVNGDYVTVDGEPHAILFIRDIGARNQHTRQIAFLAYHDPLTGLSNRRHFYDKLAEALKEAHEREGELLLMLIDLDDFKLVNDRFGHEAGDLVLGRVAGLIREAVEPSGLAARFGGDEFVLLFPLEQDGMTAPELRKRIEHTVAQGVPDYGGEQLHIRMSIGISRYPQDGDVPDDLLRCADHRMYEEKRGGGEA